MSSERVATDVVAGASGDAPAPEPKAGRRVSPRWVGLILAVVLIDILAFIVFKALNIDEKFNMTATNATFFWDIITTWMVMWLFVLGPIKIFFIRWRFNGGRIFF